MRYLNGSDIAEYIKVRQIKQFKAVRSSEKIMPKMAIIRMGDQPVTSKYLELKQAYGQDIGVQVDVFQTTDDSIIDVINRFNGDKTYQGMIIQLPLEASSKTEAAVAAVASEKDIDGLSLKTKFIPATALAIDRLLAGYNISLKAKKITIVGSGRLVGAPLAKLWLGAKLDVTVCDDQTKDIDSTLIQSDIVVSATGQPGLIKPNMLKTGAVVVDAGTSTQAGKLVGDLDEAVYQRDDLSLTPRIGGVGPLTIASLFDNLLEACQKTS